MTEKRIKIGYLSSRDARNIREWSGTMYHMANSLEKHVGEVVFLGPYKPRFIIFYMKVLNKVSLYILGKRYGFAHSYLMSMAYKLRFESRIKKEKPDIIFAATATPEISRIKTSIPIVNLNDTTFELLVDNYSNFTKLLPFSRRRNERTEKAANLNSAAFVVSSDWARRSLINYYGMPDNKIHIISYGANLSRIPQASEIQLKPQGTTKILFLGVDWQRKGGAIAFNAFVDLTNRGIDAELTVIGCTPPEYVKHAKLSIIPFLDKNKERDFERLYSILSDTHLMLVPSRGDCTPIVFCEANAFGIPVISTDVGGISSVIEDGKNGILLPLEASPALYADKMEELLKNPQRYSELVVTSRKYYDEKLNWNKWGEEMSKLFHSLIN